MSEFVDSIYETVVKKIQNDIEESGESRLSLRFSFNIDDRNELVNKLTNDFYNVTETTEIESGIKSEFLLIKKVTS
ncbi:hypothetical protein CTY75_01400 [Acinetobacter baumannii]|nr:hypothetical protein [Acinetobacter baumannii]